jgi:phage terminase large subunit-like protein
MLAANRVGKTESVGGYELTLHLTGQYPDWWKGRRFSHPVSTWAAGDSGKTVREILQFKLMGPIGAWGTGLIPGDAIARTTRAMGMADTLDSVFVKHAAGGVSHLGFKSYEQGRESFQGTEKDVVWLDEEPPLDIYTECLLRTMTNDGMVLCTFTPLQGLSDVVQMFLPGGKLGAQAAEGRYVVMATWDDAPHLDEAAKKELWAAIPPFQRDARSKGVPQLGSGAIYPVLEAEVVIPDFPLPKEFPRTFGLDTDMGAGFTAAVWIALNRETQTGYVYDCFKRSRAELAVHIDAIKSRGAWIPGVGDAAALIVTAHDAEQLIGLYRKAGINIQLPDKSVEAGIQRVWEVLSQGKLKVFQSCQSWFEEFRLYRRDDKGRIVKQNDHLMDATRYAVMSGLQRAKTAPVIAESPKPQPPSGPQGWMA